MGLNHGGVKNAMVNSQPPDSYIFFWLLLSCIGNDTEKSKIFVNLVLHNLQKSRVCSGLESPRQTLQKGPEGERERVFPHGNTGLLWKP